jgi:hypothetical protein
MTGMLRNAFVISLLAVALIAATAGADTIYLKNGGKVKGKVVKDDGLVVTIDIGSGTVVQNKADIVRIRAEAEFLEPKKPEAVKVDEEESATPMIDTKKNKKGLFGMVEGVVDTAFSILKFDFLKKDK